MASQKLLKYRKLITNMPLGEHACYAKRDLWRKYEKKDSQLLWVLDEYSNENGGKKLVVISRGDLFKLGKMTKTKKNMRRLIYATFLWGFPNGGRGWIKKIIKNIKPIVNLLQNPPVKESEWKSFKDKADKIHGLGVATVTKLLYFMGSRIDGNQALILDSKVISVFERHVFPDFEHSGITVSTALTKYSDCLKVMNKVARDINVTPDKLEMFLFAFGTSIKAS